MPNPNQSKQTVLADQPTLCSKIWNVIKNACCIFALCSALLILINWIIAGSLDEATIFVDAFFMLYIFSLGVSVAHTIRQNPQLALWVKCVCHPLLCLGGIFLAYLPYMTRNNFPVGSVMVHLLAFAVAYGLAMVGVYLVSLVCKGKCKKNSNGQTADDTYQPLFSKKDSRH